MRGALHGGWICPSTCRIIPADAGSTLLCYLTFCDKRDHPRGCGEHDISVIGRTMSSGSSPRMRGALTGDRSIPAQAGIIPADAGSTGMSLVKGAQTADHPRGCGEHSVLTHWTLTCSGSSPRMRGALDGLMQRKARHGIIPADAGSTPPV